MKTRYLISFCLLGLGACATVENETRSTIIVDGRPYELRTSVMTGSNGTYERSAVVVRNKLYTCLPQSRGDCEAAVRMARNGFDRND